MSRYTLLVKTNGEPEYLWIGRSLVTYLPASLNNNLALLSDQGTPLASAKVRPDYAPEPPILSPASDLLPALYPALEPSPSTQRTLSETPVQDGPGHPVQRNLENGPEPPRASNSAELL